MLAKIKANMYEKCVVCDRRKVRREIHVPYGVESWRICNDDECYSSVVNPPVLSDEFYSVTQESDSDVTTEVLSQNSESDSDSEGDDVDVAAIEEEYGTTGNLPAVETEVVDGQVS